MENPDVSVSSRPGLAIMIGDPAGVGPEIVARSWASGEIHQVCRPVLIGSGAVMRQAIQACGLSLAVNLVDVLCPILAKHKVKRHTVNKRVCVVIRVIVTPI